MHAVAPEEGRPLKFVFFPLGWLLAHVGRMVEIGKELRARGHEVVFAGADPAHARSKLGMADAQGFRVARTLEPDHPYAWDRFVRHGWLVTAWDLYRHQEWAPLDAILDAQIQLTQREKPDMVVGDGTFTVSTAAHIVGLPAAGIMNAYTSRFMAPWTVFNPLIRVWDRFHLAPIRRRVYRKYDRQPVNAIRLLRSIPLLSPDLAELDDSAHHWPNWHAIGPILAEPPAPLPDWYDELTDGTPNIYITMGSTGLLDTVLRRAYPVLGKMPYRFVVTTGGQATEDTMAAAPSNFRFAKFAPGSKLMERCEAVVFHGGNGTMYQALAAGIPMVALPSHLEQEICADITVRHGFGLKLAPRRVGGGKLQAAIERLVQDPALRQAAQRYTNAVREANAPVAAADLLEATAREAKPAGWDL